MIARKVLTADGSAVQSETRYIYDGSNVIEERNGDGTVAAQYVWGADGRLLLRDRDADGVATTRADMISQGGTGLDERLYALSDAAGSTTSLAELPVVAPLFPVPG